MPAPLDFYQQQQDLQRQLLDPSFLTQAMQATYQEPVKPFSVAHPIINTGISALLGAGAGAIAGEDSRDILLGMLAGGGLGLAGAGKKRAEYLQKAAEQKQKQKEKYFEYLYKLPETMGKVIDNEANLGYGSIINKAREASGYGDLDITPDSEIYNKDTAKFVTDLYGNQATSEATGGYEDRTLQITPSLQTSGVQSGVGDVIGQILQKPPVNNISGKLQYINNDQQPGLSGGTVYNQAPINLFMPAAQSTSLSNNFQNNIQDTLTSSRKQGQELAGDTLKRGETQRHNFVTEGQGERKTSAYVGRQGLLNQQTSINIDKVLNPQKYEVPTLKELNQMESSIKSTLMNIDDPKRPKQKLSSVTSSVISKYMTQRGYMDEVSRQQSRKYVYDKTGHDPEIYYKYLKSNFDKKQEDTASFADFFNQQPAEQPPLNEEY